MKTSLLTMTALVALLFCTSSLLAVSATSTSPQSVVPSAVVYAAYSPSALEVNFPFTNLVNTTVAPAAGGLFTYKVTTTSPVAHIIYNLNASDTYMITLRVTYPISYSGNITWTLFSPGLLEMGGQAPFHDSTNVSLSIEIQNLPYEQFPSAAQIANATSGLLFSELQANQARQVQESNQQFAAENQQILIENIVLGVVTVITTFNMLLIWKRTKND